MRWLRAPRLFGGSANPTTLIAGSRFQRPHSCNAFPGEVPSICGGMIAENVPNPKSAGAKKQKLRSSSPEPVPAYASNCAAR
jgi:hypothetical protein